MRILFLAPDVDLREQDGQAVHVLSLLRALENLQVEVLLLVAFAPSRGSDGNVRTIRNSGYGSFLDTMRSARHFRPDVIYERRSTPKLGAILGKCLGLPHFLEINGLAELEGEVPAKRPRLRFRARRRLIQGCNGVVVPSQGLARAISITYGIPSSRITVAPNGVDLSLFGPGDRDEARHSLGWNRESKVVAYVGKLAPWQGLETLVDAAALIDPRVRPQIAIVGDGPLKSALETRIAHRGVTDACRLMGPLAHRSVPTVLTASDVCVAPFTRERNERLEVSPLKLFEYMAAGRAVVVSDVPGVRQIIRDAGLYVSPGAPAALADTLTSVLSQPSLLAELGRRGSEYAREHSWRRTAEIILRTLSTSSDPRHTKSQVQGR